MPDTNRTDTPAARAASVRRMFYFVLLTAGVGFAVGSFVLWPLFTRFQSDVAYQNAWWVFVLYYLTREGLWNLAIYALAYTATLYAVWRAGFKKSLRVILLFIGLTLCNPVMNFVMDAVTAGAIPNMAEYWAIDFPRFILPQLALDLSQYALVVLIAALVKWRYEDRIRVAEGMKLLPASKRVDYPMPPPPFPFVKLVSFKNPLQCGALLTSLTVLILRAGMYLINDITEYVFNGYSAGWMSMLIDLVSHGIIAVLMYFTALLLLLRIHRRDGEKG